MRGNCCAKSKDGYAPEVKGFGFGWVQWACCWAAKCFTIGKKLVTGPPTKPRLAVSAILVDQRFCGWPRVADSVVFDPTYRTL